MSQPSSSLRLRWLLAIFDGFWALAFLFLGYLAADLMLRLFSEEFAKLNVDVVRAPRLTVLLIDILPEAGWGLFLGIVCLAVAYGRLSFSTQDSITQRLFRWSVAALMFILLAASLPLFDLLTPLSRPLENSWWLDEAVFVVLCLLLAAWSFLAKQEKR